MLRLWRIIFWGLFLLCPSITAGMNLLNGPESVEYDSLHNRYLVSNWYNATIVQIDSLGRQKIFNSDLAGYGSNMGGLHIYNGTLYAATCYGSLPGLWGFDLMTGDTVANRYIFGMILPNDITSDTSGFLYITDVEANKIYKVNPIDMTFSTFVRSGLNNPNGICFDRRNNRLLVVSNGYHSPVQAVSLIDSSVSVVVATDVGNHDGITEDCFGNFYISSWGFHTIYRYDSSFLEPPQLISSGLSGPADIFVDKKNNILAVPNIFGNRIDFIELFLSFESDATWGWPPLSINFTGNCEFEATDWTWDFGDNDSAFIQSPSHIYQAPGIYDVSLSVNAMDGALKRTRKNYVIALSDSLKAPEIAIKPGNICALEISCRNIMPLDYIQIPLEYAGTAEILLDSISTAGCRTEHFDTVTEVYSDEVNKRKTFRIYNFRDDTPYMDPGSGPILNLYFTIPSSIGGGQSVPIALDGFSSENPEFGGAFLASYTPAVVNGEINIYKCGDVDGSNAVNILDVSFVVSYLYKGGPAPHPSVEADVDHSGSINILDVGYTISYLYKGGPAPNCP